MREMRANRVGRPGRIALLAVLSGLTLMSAPEAAEVRFFRMQNRAAFLPGTLDGIGIDAVGTLQLADQVERLRDIEEPFLFSAAAHPDGWVVGTGNAGKVLLVERSGATRTLLTAAEPEIFAVWADPDGTVFAGSSPDGKVYRIQGGEAKVFFEPGETYIWALARAADGDLLVATGTQGKLFKVDAAGKGTLFYDSDDVHLRALKLLPGGDLLVGTAGEGLILRLAPDGSARTLYDARQPEVVAFAAAPGVGCFAAVLASEASLVESAKRDAASAAKEPADSGEAKAEAGDDEDETPTVTVTEGGDFDELFEPVRGKGSRGPRSEILRISDAGAVESVASFDDETVYTLLWLRDRLWVGTGLEGKLYSLRDDKMVLEQDVDERQVVALLPDRPGPAFATTNAAALYVVTDRPEQKGTYTSPALDAGQISRFGTLGWMGELPEGARVSFSARSGMSAEPDRTWSPWSAPGSGPEVPLDGLPAGRYVQWRAELDAGKGGSPLLSGVTLSYLQSNLAPRIVRFAALDPGQVLVRSNFNPGDQVFEPVHPTREGIFTTLDLEGERAERRYKALWKLGYQTLRWRAEDDNKDDLIFDLDFRPDRAGAPWMPLAKEVDDDHYGFDATSLPDGPYRFRLRASDAPSNGPGGALTEEEVSDVVIIDHSPPTLGAVEHRDGKLRVEVADRLNPLREASVSVNAGSWEDATPADGLLDGRSETLVVEEPAAGEVVLLRVMDAAFNAVTFDISKGVR